MSLLAAGLIVGIIIGGAFGAHYASKLITPGRGANMAAAVGVVVGTVVVANVAGAYFNYKWNGYEPDGADYVAPIYMSFLGIATPLWRAFGNSWDKSILKEYKQVSFDYCKTHKAIMDMLNAQSESSEIEKAKKELQAVYEYFSKGNLPFGDIEMDDMTTS